MKKTIILLIIIATTLAVNTYALASENKEIQTTSVKEKAEVSKVSDNTNTEIETNGSYEGDTEYKDYTNIYIMVGVGILVLGTTAIIIKRKK